MIRPTLAVLAILIVLTGAAPAATDGRWNGLDLIVLAAIFGFLWAAWPLLDHPAHRVSPAPPLPPRRTGQNTH